MKAIWKPCLKAGKKFFDLFLFSLLLTGIEASAARPVSAQLQLKDALGTVVLAPGVPKRIVTLAPSLGELVADFLDTDLSTLVGVSEYTDYPPKLKEIESIGSYARFNLEKVVALKPDLVLATVDGNAKDQVLHLRELGLAVVVVSTSSFREVTESIKIVATALGRETQGRKMADQLQVGIDRIGERAKKRAIQVSPKVLLQLGENPLVVVGGETFLDEALKTIGAQNSYGNTSARYPRPSLEDVVQKNPDVIVVLALGEDLRPFNKMATSWSKLKNLKAVNQGRVKVLQGDSILRPTLRLLEGLALLEKTVFEP